MDYTSVRCTERLTAALEETAGDRERTAAEIMEWRGTGDDTTIPFSLVQKVHEQLTANTQPESKFSSHESTWYSCNEINDLFLQIRFFYTSCWKVQNWSCPQSANQNG